MILLQNKPNIYFFTVSEQFFHIQRSSDKTLKSEISIISSKVFSFSKSSL